MEKKLRDKFLIIPIIMLLAYLLFRLIDTSALINNFPFDYANDLSAHLVKLFFLDQYGYSGIIPHWYNGYDYTLFQSYPPGYYYAALPILKLLGNVQLATYVFLILIYLAGFIAVYFLMKDLSKVKRIAFYLLFFANPVAIGYLLRLGKLPELTGWLLNLIIFGIIIYYKDRPLDKKFLFFIPAYASSLLSNVSSFIVMSPLILGFFLIKTKKEKIYIALAILFSLIITAFWWIPFYFGSLTTSLGTEAKYTLWLVENAPNSLFTFTVDKMTTFLASLLLIIFFYLHWKSNKSKREFLLFLPLSIEALLILTRLIIYIPVYNRPPPDTFNIGFILIASYLFLKTNYPDSIRKIITYLLIIIVTAGIIASIIITPLYPRLTSLDKETIELLPLVKGNFIVLGNEASYSRAYYSYAPIYYNLTTISGWIDQVLKEEDANRINNLLSCYKSAVVQCKNPPLTPEEILEEAKALNVGSIIMYGEDCIKMEKTSQIVKKSPNVCLIYT